MRKILAFVLIVSSVGGSAGTVFASDSFSVGDSTGNQTLGFYRDTTPFVTDTSYHHSWKRATIWSACLPGAGQIYNEFGYRKEQGKKHRAWWKVPIIYGALGVTSYYFYQNLSLARSLKAEWIYRGTYGDSLRLYPEFTNWKTDELITGYFNGLTTDPGFDIASKRRDMLGFAFLAIWGLNVVEALVDGHFVTFDVSEDLSLSWSPTVLNYTTPGIALRLNFN